MECKQRSVNFRRASDPTRGFRLAFGVTEIPDDCYWSSMGVIVISLGSPLSAGEIFGCTWEHLGAPATSLGVRRRSLSVPMTGLGAPPIAVEQSGKNNIFFFGNAAGAPGNHSYYLSFNNC